MNKFIQRLTITFALGLLLTAVTIPTEAQDSGYNSPAQQQIRRDMIRNAIRRQSGGGGNRMSRRYSSHSRRRHHRRHRR